MKVVVSRQNEKVHATEQPAPFQNGPKAKKSRFETGPMILAGIRFEMGAAVRALSPVAN